MVRMRSDSGSLLSLVSIIFASAPSILGFSQPACTPALRMLTSSTLRASAINIACSARRGCTEGGDASRKGEPAHGPAEQQRQLRLPGRRAAILRGVAAVGTLAYWQEGAGAKYIDEWGFEEEGDGSMEELGLKRQRVSDNIQRMKEKYSSPLPYQAVRDSIQQTLLEDPDLAPTLIRLAWHSSGTYSRMANNGGSSGGTMRFKEELKHEANAGLSTAVEKLEKKVKKKHRDISYADLYTLAGAVAVETMGGPQIPWRSGRVDAPSAKSVTPNGRLPDPDKGSPKSTAAHLREVFGRMGFGDQEIVALSGAHAVGECHINYSGYAGPWTTTPNIFNNMYFVFLSKLKWEPHSDYGKMQYRAFSSNAEMMMLPSDIALLEDEDFSRYVKLYAMDQEAWYRDFAAAFSKLLELGTSNLKDS